MDLEVWSSGIILDSENDSGGGGGVPPKRKEEEDIWQRRNVLEQFWNDCIEDVEGT